MKYPTGASTAAHRTSTHTAFSGRTRARPSTTPGCHGRFTAGGADEQNWHKPVRVSVPE